MRSRTAMSLLEVVIAMTLFAALMVALIETAVSVKGVTEQHEELLELEREGRTIIARVSEDLGNSGWFDNGVVRLPAIVPPPPLPAPPNSFGNPVRFLRIRSVPATQNSVGISRFDFSAPVTAMQDWKTPTTVIPGLVADGAFDNNGSGRLVMPVWEPRGDLLDGQLDFDANRNPNNLRIYLYNVEPTTSGRGTLRRYIAEGNAAPYVRDADFGDLGSHIYHFDVILTQGTQRVRLSLELRKDIPGKPRAVRRFDAVIAMRSAY